MKVRGQITIFLSMIILSVASLICVLLESARMEGARCYLQTAAGSSLDSVLGQYHRDMWDQYRLLFAEYEDEEELTEDFEAYLAPYLEKPDWYPMQIVKTDIEEMQTAVDDGGGYLEQEILDYMKYGIWEMLLDGDAPALFHDSSKAAGEVKEVAEIYRKDTKELWKLEEALEAISANLSSQSAHYEIGMKDLNQYDGYGLISEAEGMTRDCERMPGCIETYRTWADLLETELIQDRQEFEARKDEWDENTKRQMEYEMEQYEAYVNVDGSRRREIEALVELSAQNKAVAQDTIAAAEEVQEIIDNWDYDDEEDDGPDLDALWEGVAGVYSGFHSSHLSFLHGIQDKKKKHTLEQIEGMCQSRLLELVVPEGKTVSGGMIQAVELPSDTSAWPAGSQSRTMVDHWLINEYCGEFFTSFLSTEHKEIQYELEYLFAGEKTDEANLYQAVKQLLAVREGLNLMFLLADSAKREEANQLAMTITGATGLVPLIMATAFFILSVWALGEAILDIRLLLRGEKVPLVKQAGDWKLSLSGLLNFGETGAVAGEESGGRGLDYQTYLKGLLLLHPMAEQDYRMMDVMQWNIGRKQSSFRIRRCVYHAAIQVVTGGKHIFFSPGFVENMLQSGAEGYQIQAEVEKAY